MKTLKTTLQILLQVLLTYLNANAQCSDVYSILGTGQLQLQWSGAPTGPAGLASINFDGTNYVGSYQAPLDNWETTAATFAASDDNGSHTIDLLDGSGSSLRTGCIFQDGALDAAAMPIELVSFRAGIEGNSVNIYWETATEFNNNYFSIERSKDGEIFEPISKVNAAGNSTVTNSYGIVDANPLSGTSYYRLKQTDFGGAFTYSNVVSVKFENKDAGVSIFPNPSNGRSIGIELSGFDEDEIAVSIYNSLGKQIESKLIANNSMVSYAPEKELENGIYFVVANGKSKNFKSKLVVTN